MAPTMITRVWPGYSCNDEAEVIRVMSVDFSASFLMPASPLGIGVHMFECIGCKKHVAPEIRVEKYSVTHGKVRSITSPS